MKVKSVPLRKTVKFDGVPATVVDATESMIVVVAPASSSAVSYTVAQVVVDSHSGPAERRYAGGWYFQYQD